MSSAGAVTSILSVAAAGALDYQIRTIALLIKPIGYEYYFEYDPTIKPQPCWEKRQRLVVQAWLVHWDKEDKPLIGADLAEEQLKRGFAWLGRLSAIELDHINFSIYRAAQLEAQAKKKGIWFYGTQPWAPLPIERKPDKPLPMPTRAPLKK